MPRKWKRRVLKNTTKVETNENLGTESLIITLTRDGDLFENARRQTDDPSYQLEELQYKIDASVEWISAIQLLLENENSERDVDQLQTNATRTLQDCVLSALQSQMDASESLVDTARSQIDSAQSLLDAAQSLVDADELQVDVVRSHINSVRSNIAVLKSHIGEVRSQMDALDSLRRFADGSCIGGNHQQFNVDQERPKAKRPRRKRRTPQRSCKNLKRRKVSDIEAERTRSEVERRKVSDLEEERIRLEIERRKIWRMERQLELIREKRRRFRWATKTFRKDPRPSTPDLSSADEMDPKSGMVLDCLMDSDDSIVQEY